MAKPDLTDASTRRAWRAYAAAALTGLLSHPNPDMTPGQWARSVPALAAEFADLMVDEEQERGTRK